MAEQITAIDHRRLNVVCFFICFNEKTGVFLTYNNLAKKKNTAILYTTVYLNKKQQLLSKINVSGVFCEKEAFMDNGVRSALVIQSFCRKKFGLQSSGKLGDS